MVIVECGCSSGNVKGKTNLRNIWGVYQEHLIIDGTIEEKERDGLKKNLNYVGSHQFDTLIFTEHLLHVPQSRCLKYTLNPTKN